MPSTRGELWPRASRPSKRPSDNWLKVRFLKSPPFVPACDGARTQCRRYSVFFPNTTAFRSWATNAACDRQSEPHGRTPGAINPINPHFLNWAWAGRRLLADMKNITSSVQEANRPAADAPGSVNYRSGLTALALIGRAGTGGRVPSAATTAPWR